MGMNPPPIERQIGGWGWWRDQSLATLIVFRGMYGWEPDAPLDIAEDAKALTYRGFHPETAIRVHVEGFARYGHARGPAGFTGARTWEDWLRDFPHPRGDVRRRR